MYIVNRLAQSPHMSLDGEPTAAPHCGAFCGRKSVVTDLIVHAHGARLSWKLSRRSNKRPTGACRWLARPSTRPRSEYVMPTAAGIRYGARRIRYRCRASVGLCEASYPVRTPRRRCPQQSLPARPEPRVVHQPLPRRAVAYNACDRCASSARPASVRIASHNAQRQLLPALRAFGKTLARRHRRDIKMNRPKSYARLQKEAEEGNERLPENHGYGGSKVSARPATRARVQVEEHEDEALRKEDEKSLHAMGLDANKLREIRSQYGSEEQGGAERMADARPAHRKRSPLQDADRSRTAAPPQGG